MKLFYNIYNNVIYCLIVHIFSYHNIYDIEILCHGPACAIVDVVVIGITVTLSLTLFTV